MALRTKIGGIKINDNQFTTVLPVSKLMEITVGGMAFERSAKDKHSHVARRVEQLATARGCTQRSFYKPGRRWKKQKNLESGTIERVQVETRAPTAKLSNTRGSLRKYIEGPYIDAPLNDTAAMPAMILYCPEQLAEESSNFDASMGGEFHIYDLSSVGKAMILDGESRHHALELALAGNLSGPRKEILRDKLMTIEVHHGLKPAAMGQVFADLNGKGIRLSSNEAAARDVRDKWSLTTRRVFGEMGVTLKMQGRQVSPADIAHGEHLMFGHARTMMRAIGLGSIAKVVSKSGKQDAEVDFDRLADSGKQWMGTVLEHFGGPEVFTNPNNALKAMSVKVAVALMGHDWYFHNTAKQVQHLKTLKEVDWAVGEHWTGIAGRVTSLPGHPGGIRLTSSGVKENGHRASAALLKPESEAWVRVRVFKY